MYIVVIMLLLTPRASKKQARSRRDQLRAGGDRSEHTLRPFIDACAQQKAHDRLSGSTPLFNQDSASGSNFPLLPVAYQKKKREHRGFD